MNEYNLKLKNMNNYSNSHFINKIYDSSDDENEDIHKNQLNNKTDLAEYLNKNMGTMTNEELKLFLLKCTNTHSIKKRLLKYELFNLIPEKKNNISLYDFSYVVFKYLKRYQSKAGGFQIEDKEWTLYTNDICDINIHDKYNNIIYNQNKYPLLENEIIFENTILENSINDNETTCFLIKLTHLLNKIDDTIKVSYKIINSNSDKIYWIILKCKKIIIE
jgi:hypothetical protein